MLYSTKLTVYVCSLTCFCQQAVIGFSKLGKQVHGVAHLWWLATSTCGLHSDGVVSSTGWLHSMRRILVKGSCIACKRPWTRCVFLLLLLEFSFFKVCCL
jgi:hypothetical protein